MSRLFRLAVSAGGKRFDDGRESDQQAADLRGKGLREIAPVSRRGEGTRPAGGLANGAKQKKAMEGAAV